MGPLDLWTNIMVVPYFWFTSTQTIGITPLVSTEGSNSYSGQGYPYIAVKLQPTLFRFFSPDAEYEFQRLNFSNLDPVDDSTWTTIENSYTVHTLGVRGSFRIPLFTKGRAEIGSGRKVTWTVPEDGKTVVDNKGIFKLTFSLEK
ncbi:MAG: hypothetical protein A3J97_08545 [Spirochaetes bacterium RIFOXYC1_FULL_54_7]|nr:MAG: hypothetical protein A3J97_08545 [Spirochaetes bacterium RIFOXYC1_FULL_54_7]